MTEDTLEVPDEPAEQRQVAGREFVEQVHHCGLSLGLSYGRGLLELPVQLLAQYRLGQLAEIIITNLLITAL